MNKLIDSFNNLLKNDRPQFVAGCVRIGVAILYFLSFFFSFFVVAADTVNRVGGYELPGAGIFILLLWALIVVHAFVTILGHPKYMKLTSLFQAILASVFFLWGLILFFTTLSEAANYVGMTVVPGFGFVLQLVLIGLLWFVTFGDAILMRVVGRFVRKPAVAPEPAAAIEPEPQPEAPPVKPE